MLSPEIDKQYNIFALHGFLGKADDWNNLGVKNERFFAWDVFKDLPVSPFPSWAENFNHKVSENPAAAGNILMGYSLGGRLGLHALLQDPKKWKAAIFISTHPGLKSSVEKQARIRADHEWAHHFESEAWNPLMTRWNSQGVFLQDPFTFKREEADFCRKTLSQALKIWSLGIQGDLSGKIKSLDIPILWMVGAEDAKFLEKAKELEFRNAASELYVVPQAAHRLPWQQPEKFLRKITEFIQRLE
jgi:2-succinyl-6-hydroxy-2,4-cyclohexadiene-1-carboxylate synthase